MNFLLDTNILLRDLDITHPHHPAAVTALAKFVAKGCKLHLVSQTLYEGWVSLTRPLAANGLGKSPADAFAIISRWEAIYPVLDDTPNVRSHWQQLVTTHAVSGKNAHDARLVAAMLTHGLTHLLTFNDADFQRFTAVVTVTPAGVLASP